MESVYRRPGVVCDKVDRRRRLRSTSTQPGYVYRTNAVSD